VGTSVFAVTHRDDHGVTGEAIRETAVGGPSARIEKRYVRKDGSVVQALVSTSLVRNPDGTPRHYVTGVLDVTAQREAEAALSRARMRFAELYEGLGDGIVGADEGGHILEFNEAYHRMLGYEPEELRRLTFYDVTPARWHEAERRILAEATRSRTPIVTYEKEYRRKDGTTFPIELRVFLEDRDGGPQCWWAIVRDITEERKLRDQLAVTSRLAAMGTLVAGIAHEINNPLGAAIASHGFAAEELSRLRDRFRSGQPVDLAAEAGNLAEVVDALGDAATGELRVAAIVKDLTLLGRPNVRPTRVSPARAVQESMRWIPAKLLARADVEIEDQAAPEVAASEGQLAQVVANLVANAIRSVPEWRRASIRIRSGHGEPGHARIEVQDDGAGMTPEVMRRMFDPFFSTRAVGQGMGLGLAICHAIVTAHGGRITATSEAGKGSTFRVELPVAA
jgi:PAS domain S-box-containing protein